MFSSFQSVPEGNRSAPEFRKAVALLAHIVAARQIWLGRLGEIPAVSGTCSPMFKPSILPGWRPIGNE